MLYAEYIQLNEVYMKPPLRVRRIFLTGNLERSRLNSAFDNSLHVNHVITALSEDVKERKHQGVLSTKNKFTSHRF